LKSLAHILPGLLDSLGLADRASGWRAVLEWNSIAGARIARHSRAVAFRDGVLTVEVEGSAWMHELGFLRRELVSKTNRHLGSDIVREVRLVPAQGGHRR
jgi:predicted nucleic acid-binding Zn ribbon protein